MSRLELFQNGELIDTVNVHRYTREELNELMEEMGQYRDKTMTWEKINARKNFDNMLNNWDAFQEITETPEQRTARMAKKTQTDEL